MKKKLSLSALTALVLSSMLGTGVFSLPQNMAVVASSSALLIGWGITGTGILLLVFSMILITRIRPDLDGGIFAYAYEGFGELIGFCSAWGYWLCAVIANVSYLVMVFSALSFFTDSPQLHLFGDGNTWQSIIGASLSLWLVHWLILSGVQTAANINLIATHVKLIPLCLFIVLAFVAFRFDVFIFDFSNFNLSIPIWEQVKNTMLITLWVFIGVEGAVVVSARAHNKHDVGRATLLAVLIALSVYLLVTLLSLGIVARPELMVMRNPSMAGLMIKMIGSWGDVIIAAGLIISVCGAYLSWTIMAAEVPFLAAVHKVFPLLFTRQNKNNAPSASLWLTNISVQICLVLIWITNSNYNTLLTIASEMILIPYLLVGAFLLKIAIRPSHYAVGMGACFYGLWLLYASGSMRLLLSEVLYAPGLLVFIYARRTYQLKNALRRYEILVIILILISTAPVIYTLIRQGFSFLLLN